MSQEQKFALFAASAKDAVFTNFGEVIGKDDYGNAKVKYFSFYSQIEKTGPKKLIVELPEDEAKAAFEKLRAIGGALKAESEAAGQEYSEARKRYYARMEAAQKSAIEQAIVAVPALAAYYGSAEGSAEPQQVSAENGGNYEDPDDNEADEDNN